MFEFYIGWRSIKKKTEQKQNVSFLITKSYINDIIFLHKWIIELCHANFLNINVDAINF